MQAFAPPKLASSASAKHPTDIVGLAKTAWRWLSDHIDKAMIKANARRNRRQLLRQARHLAPHLRRDIGLEDHQIYQAYSEVKTKVFLSSASKCATITADEPGPRPFTQPASRAA